MIKRRVGEGFVTKKVWDEEINEWVWAELYNGRQTGKYMDDEEYKNYWAEEEIGG